MNLNVLPSDYVCMCYTRCMHFAWDVQQQSSAKVEAAIDMFKLDDKDDHSSTSSLL